MNTLNKLKFAVLIALIAGASSCKDKENTNPTGLGYLLGYRTAGTPTADYLLTTNDIKTGVISATGTGQELDGWNYYGKAGNTYFALNYTDNICVGYNVVDGQLKEKGRFAFERMDCMTEGPDNNMIAIGAPWGGGSFDCQIQLVDAVDVSIHHNKKTPIYVSYDSTGGQLNAWPTHSYVDGDKFLVSFYPLHGTSWATPLTDTAYVSVYSYPGLEYQFTFKDTRTGPIGYYGGSPAMVKDESGNHYTFSTSSFAAGFTKVTKPSGILKINKGATEFDPNYFFDVEAQGYRVLTGVYAGNGKVVARVVSASIDPTVPAWAAFKADAPLCNIVVLDLNAKSLTLVSSVPAHGGQYQTPFLVENGKVYISTNTGSEAFIYEVDPQSATAVKGARIEGKEIQSFFKY